MSRRRFLKTTAGTLALSSIPAIIIPRRVEAYGGGAQVHPHISPLRVAGLRDQNMTTAVKPNASWAEQEGLVAWDVVHRNMDRVAMGLAQESAPADAWRKIFLKPPAKAWGDTVVAIKTNQIAIQRTRSAVMSKVCHVLAGLGVKGSNIYIYDACHGSGMSRKNPFTGLPEGVHIADQWGGSSTNTTIPAPYFAGDRQAPCLAHLVRGDVDILVNIALCKGHGGEYGRFTLSLKNHYGTFSPKPSHQDGGGADYMIGINKSKEILGEIDPRTGAVLFPRQQLCIVDALWASDPGPGTPTDSQPNALFMSTFGPVMDYVVAMRFRKDTMGWRVNERVAQRLLTDFGFAESDLPNGGKIIDAMALTS